MRTLLLLFVASVTMPPAGLAQQPAECNGPVPDSLWLRDGPVFRDCEVEKKAVRRGGQPALDLDPMNTSARTSCLRVDLAFVVDTLGKAEPATVRVLSSNSPELEAAVLIRLERLQFSPAILAERRVRQVVVYSRSVAKGGAFTVPARPTPMDAPVADPKPRLRSC